MEKVSNDTDAKPEPMSVLSPIGDRELWYAEGQPDEKGYAQWRFPLFVDWKLDAKHGIEYADVHAAVCPHYKLSLILKALFENHDVLHGVNRWLVRKEVVAALLKKAPGINKEFYYRWNGQEEKPMNFTERLTPGRHEPSHLKSGPADRALITQIAAACGLQSSVVKIVIDGLNMVAAEFMVTQHRVMDLGFIKLIAVPFRANWKEIVHFKLRKLGLTQYLKEDEPTESGNAHGHTNPGLPETLCSPHNVAIRREKGKTRVDYSIEVLTSKAFEKEVTRLETRQRAAGHTAYVSYYEKTVKHLYENLLEILRAYRKKIALPFARIHPSSATGSLRFIETSSLHTRAYGRHLRKLPVHITPAARGFSALAEAGEQELVCEKASQVPKVPVVSSTADDVRQCEKPRTLEEFRDWARRTGGLLLSDAGEGAAAGQPVFPCHPAGGKPPWVEIIGG